MLTVQGQQQPRMQHLSPEGVAHLSQNKLLPLLLQRALGANEPHSIRLGHAVQSVQQTQPGVSCRVDTAEVSMQAATGHCLCLPHTDGCSKSQRSAVHFLRQNCRRMPQCLPAHASGNNHQDCLCRQVLLHAGSICSSWLAQLGHRE